MAAVPKDFVDLAHAFAAQEGTLVNIIGVVVDKMDPTTTRRSDWMLTFKITDPKLLATQPSAEGLTIRFFRQDPTHLPRVRSIGDVVLLRSIKISTFNGQRLALSHSTTSSLVFPSASIPDPNFTIGYQGSNRIECLGIPMHVEKFTLNEQQYVMSLRHALGGIVGERATLAAAMAAVPTLQAAGTVPKQKLPAEFNSALEPPAKKQKFESSLGAKFKLVRDLKEPKSFADVCGLVVKCIGAQYGGCDLYITDYTPNEQMRYYPPPEEETDRERDGDMYGYNGPPRKSWPGPYEYLVLKVNVKEPHASFAVQSIREGDCVMLRNMKTRITPMGTWLEGDMWPDDKYPNKVLITKVLNLNFPEAKALFQRRDNYWAKRDALLAPKQNEGATLSKAERKRQKRQKRKDGRQAKSGPQENVEPSKDDTSSNEHSDDASKSTRMKPDTNQYVRCRDQDISLTRIKDILDPRNLRHTNRRLDGQEYILPFINAKYRAKVRVVDFEPKDLRDFAVRPVQNDSQAISESTMDWTYESASPPSWEWHFSLLLEDASVRPEHRTEDDRIWVNIQHEQAQFLFGNRLADPGDMTGGTAGLLAQLRERLFILWGNLEEIHSAGAEEGGVEAMQQELSNLPFECCVMEYGVERDDDDPEKGQRPEEAWKRMYGMFGATIL
ncbi:unnamed protein product [Zymoseptoria tritici ST99CH_1E4]|uniref:Protection of telomeres protein 1 n=1 Tax=Zymoseptoria tritici ST99CH_1E4 TaxID=1276532 RepID=A0A2H1FYZ1_ZYMTR|nr:unnamed protein product [Zymoseptoria tritici ST99CH_1E4]